LQDLLWELRQRRIRVQVEEEIKPKEAAVNKRGLVNAANLKARTCT
jgi:hypothetical protein